MIARSSGELAVLPLSCAADQKPALILSVIHFLHNFPPCQRLVSSFISLYVSSALALQGCAFDSWLTQCRISHSLGIFIFLTRVQTEVGEKWDRQEDTERLLSVVVLHMEEQRKANNTEKKHTKRALFFQTIRGRNEKKGKGFWKRQREKGRATEIAPAGAVCWEQVVYLGQHIASSAFLPTCLSKWRRGQPARRAALLRVSASALNILSTVHAVSHTVQCVHWLKPAVPNALYIYTLSPASSSSRQTCTHTCADPRAVSNPYKHCVSLEEMMTYA